MFCHCKYSVYIDCWPSVRLCFKTFPQGIFSLGLCHCMRMNVLCICLVLLITLDESSSSSKTVCHEGPLCHRVTKWALQNFWRDEFV